MWIIPNRVLSAFSVSAQESAGWILDSESFTQLAALSLTWRGKDQPPQSWCRLLKRERWTQLLSGLTYEPSIAECFVDMWMESLVATHAKERVSPGCNEELPTPDGCGPRSPALCEILSQLGASSRTSPTTSIKDSASSDQTWKRWATELRRRYSLRKKSGRRTGGSACSSSRWLTPHGMVGVDHTGHVGAGGELDQQVRQWATPNVPNGGRVMNAEDVAAKGMTARGKRQVDLGSQTRQWSTPRASPTTRDGKDGGSPSEVTPTNSLLGRQAPRSMTSGPQSLPLPAGWTGSRLYLNPRFVEWLMGWPDGWTACAPAEMALYLYRQRMQLVCLLINWIFIGDATC